MIANIGRWPLGTLAGSTGGNPGALPWSAQRYGAQLEGLMRWLAALRHGSGIPVGFISTNAMPLHSEGRQTSCPPGYTEYPQHVSMFNQIAHDAAARRRGHTRKTSDGRAVALLCQCCKHCARAPRMPQSTLH